jgi:hypothetical protein
MAPFRHRPSDKDLAGVTHGSSRGLARDQSFIAPGRGPVCGA